MVRAEMGFADDLLGKPRAAEAWLHTMFIEGTAPPLSIGESFWL